MPLVSNRIGAIITCPSTYGFYHDSVFCPLNLKIHRLTTHILSLALLSIYLCTLAKTFGFHLQPESVFSISHSSAPAA